MKEFETVEALLSAALKYVKYLKGKDDLRSDDIEYLKGMLEAAIDVLSYVIEEG